MHVLSYGQLMEAFENAVKLSLEKEFIKLLELEINERSMGSLWEGY
ncbi:sporulation histidine kinase inhibitor Sda [Radiobacillus kanasensis]|nr:sporulation histidine kinase inhibitor Sda [Radiobacillus kanasensis]UFU00600.1 sporulation histidine kinase inhibitor Sda [Radiobacillus kanasensis]